MSAVSRDSTVSILQHVVCDPVEPTPVNIANVISNAFLASMSDFSPLSPNVRLATDNERPFTVTEQSVFQKLLALNPTKATGPDGIPCLLLKENADIFARPVMSIINCSFLESRLPPSWKEADIVPIPKQKPVNDVNKDLRPNSLNSVISKVAEEYVVGCFVKPAVLKKVDPQQFGTLPGLNTTYALISMLHKWNCDTDGNIATVRIVLFDFKKAFDLIDHDILIQKLVSYEIPNNIVNWIIDFLLNRKQRVKLCQDCVSEWGSVPAGVPQGTKLGPWLFLVMINDLNVPNDVMWKYVDDSNISETVKKDEVSHIQSTVDEFVRKSKAEKFVLSERKCKEMRISFTKSEKDFPPIMINNAPLEVVPHAKILGLNVSDNLKWNCHVSELVKKSSKRLYFLTQLKRAKVGCFELVQIFKSCIRSLIEYARPVYHDGLPTYLSRDLETIQQNLTKIPYYYQV